MEELQGSEEDPGLTIMNGEKRKIWDFVPVVQNHPTFLIFLLKLDPLKSLTTNLQLKFNRAIEDSNIKICHGEYPSFAYLFAHPIAVEYYSVKKDVEKIRYTKEGKLFLKVLDQVLKDAGWIE